MKNGVKNIQVTAFNDPRTVVHKYAGKIRQFFAIARPVWIDYTFSLASFMKMHMLTYFNSKLRCKMMQTELMFPDAV